MAGSAPDPRAPPTPHHPASQDFQPQMHTDQGIVRTMLRSVRNATASGGLPGRRAWVGSNADTGAVSVVGRTAQCSTNRSNILVKFTHLVPSVPRLQRRLPTHLDRQTAGQAISEPDVQRRTVPSAVRPSPSLSPRLIVAGPRCFAWVAVADRVLPHPCWRARSADRRVVPVQVSWFG